MWGRAIHQLIGNCSAMTRGFAHQLPVAFDREYFVTRYIRAPILSTGNQQKELLRRRAVRSAARYYMAFWQQPTNRNDGKDQQNYRSGQSQYKFHCPPPLFLWRSRILACFARHSMPRSPVSNSPEDIRRNIFLTNSGSSTVFCS